mmetsp:Transcript_21888/g.29294  ORF Transcript_21888/g.29294 Transcript_21888/m.29294 type:complete len:123 (-) Transcript_21888:773-1141(-)
MLLNAAVFPACEEHIELLLGLWSQKLLEMEWILHGALSCPFLRRFSIVLLLDWLLFAVIILIILAVTGHERSVLLFFGIACLALVLAVVCPFTLALFIFLSQRLETVLSVLDLRLISGHLLG